MRFPNEVRGWTPGGGLNCDVEKAGSTTDEVVTPQAFCSSAEGPCWSMLREVVDGPGASTPLSPTRARISSMLIKDRPVRAGLDGECSVAVCVIEVFLGTRLGVVLLARPPLGR